MSLCFQGFEDEVRSLPGKYVLPEGRLYVAYADGDLAGCIALRKLDDGICEMKRLFVRENFRSLGLGRTLVEKLITSARAEGYKQIRLDTFPPKMGKAVGLYESFGFHPIAAYYDNPHKGVLFMEKQLFAWFLFFVFVLVHHRS